MSLPILKYYFSAPITFKLRLYIQNYTLYKITLEDGSRDQLECLFYADVNPCDPKLLSNIQMILAWLHAYFLGKPLPSISAILADVTPFTSLVLNALQDIPFGTTLTYQELAIRIGNPKAARAVGTALHQNPLPLIFPCHRIVSKKDGLGGFAYSLKLKALLLEFESSRQLIPLV